MEENTVQFKPVRKTFSIIGFSLCIYIIVGIVMQLVFAKVPGLIWGYDNWYYNTSWGQWISSFVPMYGFALPVVVLIMRKIPSQKPIENKLSFGKMFVYFAISYFIMSAGNIIGTVLALIFSGGKAQNPVTEIAMDENPLKMVVVVILAPLFEELIFRKLMLDRIGKYGEKTAVLLTALAFGLLHQNLFQFFYAFGIGLIFGYIYIRTGKIRYSVILHTIINFMGGVIAPFILTLFDSEKLMSIQQNGTAEEVFTILLNILPGIIFYLLYTMFLYGIIISGLVLFIIKIKELRWENSPLELSSGTIFKTAYLNVGMICYILICGVFIVLSLF